MASKNETKEIPESEKKNSQSEKSKNALIGCLIGLICGIAFLVHSCNSCMTPSPETLARRAEEAKNGDDISATVMAQMFIKEYLKSPSSAKFHYTKNVKNKGNVWTLVGKFDSQNAFGAMIRGAYGCDLRFDGGEKWTCLYLIINNKVYIKDGKRITPEKAF